jgi:tRNA uracil 4-sulfurtransferase
MKVVCLLSSGIDSPVAASLMLDKGADVICLYMDSGGSDGERQIRKVRDVVNAIEKRTGKRMKSYVAENGNFHMQARKKCERRYHCLLCKRFMYRVAGELCKRIGADAILTGESIGQVASQTLDNLKVLDCAVDLPVIRPLIGLDKEDTISMAREYGTLDISSGDVGGCPYVPHHPSTKAVAEKVANEEGKLDSDLLVKKSFDEMRDLYD